MCVYTSLVAECRHPLTPPTSNLFCMFLLTWNGKQKILLIIVCNKNFKTSSFAISSFCMVQAIEKRISVYSQIPIENGELIQVLRWVSEWFVCLMLLKKGKTNVSQYHNTNICRSTGMKKTSSTNPIMTTSPIRLVL